MTEAKDYLKLTAYALGELSGAEAKALEQELDVGAMDEIKDIKEIASLLESEFSKEPCAKLSDSQRESLLAQEGQKRPSRFRSPIVIFGLSSAIAASLLAVFTVWSAGNFEKTSVRKMVKAPADADQSPAATDPGYSKHQFRKVSLTTKKADKKTIVALEEEVEITKTVPRGTDMSTLSNKNLDATSVTDAYGVGGGGAAPFGRRRARQLKKNPAYLARRVLDGALDVSEAGDTNRRLPLVPKIGETPFKAVQSDPLSTFSIDVDTGAYSNVRRYLKRHTRAPVDSIRIEEMINYFHYDYSPPAADVPFASHIEVSQCPWNIKNRLVRIGIKGKVIEKDKRPVSNLVFLIDVSGSMKSRNKLPLLIQGMTMLVNQLGESDRVAIVVYAGAAGVVLPSTSCRNKSTILSALRRLRAGGSTNGGQGIQVAYEIAVKNFIEGGTNRVLLATDGDFNVGISGGSALIDLIKNRAKTGVFLTVLGFGRFNRDKMLEQIANKGNGHYAIIDNLNEAKKVLVDELSGTLVTIAKDVKIQVEFNPNHVKSYRLIGYENRMLAHKDFNDDKKDAGEIGAGHTVTAFYEIVIGKSENHKTPGVDPLKYQQKNKLTAAAASPEILTLKIRYKKPDEDSSKRLSFAVADSQKQYSMASNEFKFAASVAAFGMLLRNSKHKGIANFALIKELAQEGKGPDKNGYRAEFISLIDRAMQIYPR
jgi:Ca-activated chloride channel homolog